MPERPRILIPTPTSIDTEYSRQCWPQYAAAVRESGSEAVRLELTASERDVLQAARDCDGVLLPGNLADVSPTRYGHEREVGCGPADEPRECCDWTLLGYVLTAGVPLLAICYGMQSLNVHQGGTLLQDIDVIGVRHTAGPSVGVAHTVQVRAGSRLAGMVEPAEAEDGGAGARLSINSSHHQAIGIIGEGLEVVARSTQDGVVEAVEQVDGEDRFLLGVQWHPERTLEISAASRAIFRQFAAAARRYRA